MLVSERLGTQQCPGRASHPLLPHPSSLTFAPTAHHTHLILSLMSLDTVTSGSSCRARSSCSTKASCSAATVFKKAAGFCIKERGWSGQGLRIWDWAETGRGPLLFAEPAHGLHGVQNTLGQARAGYVDPRRPASARVAAHRGPCAPPPCTPLPLDTAHPLKGESVQDHACPLRGLLQGADRDGQPKPVQELGPQLALRWVPGAWGVCKRMGSGCIAGSGRAGAGGRATACLPRPGAHIQFTPPPPTNHDERRRVDDGDALPLHSVASACSCPRG